MQTNVVGVKLIDIVDMEDFKVGVKTWCTLRESVCEVKTLGLHELSYKMK